MTRIPQDAIRALADILVDTGLTEIEVVEGDTRIRVVRAAPSVMASVAPAATPVAVAVAPPLPSPPVAAVTDDPQKNPGAILSPMVGVFYLAPEPGAVPFVTVGQVVTAGQTVALIEAMKTFNQIKAPRAGTVTRVLVASGAPVEYDEPLMIVE